MIQDSARRTDVPMNISQAFSPNGTANISQSNYWGTNPELLRSIKEAVSSLSSLIFHHNY